MREKYLDEMAPEWFVFGTRNTGGVDISDGQKDVAWDVDPVTADLLINAHNEGLRKLKTLIMKGAK